MRRIFLLSGFLFLLSSSTFAQKLISGRIIDANTKEPLPAAHVIIKGTYQGTIANADGEFSLQVDTFPATIVVRFLGFESLEKEVTASFEGTLDFELKEAFLELDEITVTGEDPAISIMKEVIRRKQIWRAKLDTYQVDAYTRQQILKDTTIVSITESISEAFWDRERGTREVLKSKRQTANLEGSDNFAGVSYLPNFYDDNLDIVEFDVVGITHPDALKFYNFELVDFSKIDDNVVFEIEVKSKRKLQPLFEGTIHVLDLEYALISVRLKPNSVIVFPPPIQEFNMYYEQQFSNFGGDYWLPVDFRMDGMVEIGVPGLRFPPIGFSQISKLNDYQVNTDLPDSLYENTNWNWITVDSTTIDKSDSLFVNTLDVVPLTEKEEYAYKNVKCNTSFEEEFRPKGFLVRFMDLDDESDDDGTGNCTEEEIKQDSTLAKSISSKPRKKAGPVKKFINRLSIDARFNRVDAFFGGVKHEQRFADRRVRTTAKLGYSFGYGEGSLDGLNHGFDFSWWPLPKTRRLAIQAGYNAATTARYNSDLYGMVFTSTMPLFGYDDYFDYYRNEGIYVGARYRPRKWWRNTVGLKYRLEEHSSIDYKTSYDIIGNSNSQRLNPAINEGTLSSFEFKLERGEGKEAFGVIGADNIMLSIEQSAKAIGSDWDFTRFKVDIFRRYNTFYKRRFIPNSLDLRLNAGTYIGDLPVQRNGALDAAFGYFAPFGGFKSKRYIPYEGASYVALNVEHNFRSIPLEALGWRDAAKSGLSIITFAGVGRTWISNEQKLFFNSNLGYLPATTNDWHQEVGVSLSNIFSLFRVDLAYRIDDPGFYPTVAFARLF
ncbi:MAG: DUF5686 and carboxypeptidase-like regulatory domain-containing protein [Balneolaceae bacterium]